MLRIALSYVRPGMILGKDVYGLDGRIALATDVCLTEKHLEHLSKWEVSSLYIKNPVIELPPVDDVVQETTRLKAMKHVQATFDRYSKTKSFTIQKETEELLKSIVIQVLEKRNSIIHLAQIHRHHDDLLSHSINVCVLATMTATALGICERSDLYTISLGALFHDIGKVAIPQHILNKHEDALTAEDKSILASHPQYGFEILRKNRELPLLAAHIAYQHHERYDGSGYPRNLSKQDINRLAHIVGIASTYDNMVTGPAGQKGLDTHVAYEAIVAGVNTLYEPEVAKAFLSRIALYPIGTIVKLTTGATGVVVGVTPLMQHRPLIRLISDFHDNWCDNRPLVDLAAKENLTTFISEVVADEAALAFFQNLNAV